MKGLLLKDYLTLKSSFKTMIIVYVIFCVVGIVSENQFFIAFPAIYFSMLTTTAMSWDERCNFNHFAGIMPVKKYDIVISKYIMGIILCVISVVLGVISGIFVNAGIIESIISGISISIVYQSLRIPIIFKFGVEKSRIIMLVAFVCVFVIIGAINFITEKINIEIFISKLDSLNPATFLLLNLVILAVIYIVSMLISLVINKNKEW